PFESGVKRGIVKALNPDLTLIHGLAADVHGNTILAPPYVENNFGAFASKKGALVTVEKLVSTEFIRKYSHLVKLPCNIVRSVSVVPFGAHPLGVSAAGIPEIEVYAEDFDFIKNARIACRNTKDLDEWVKKWVLECPDQEEYIRRLGQKRIMRLKGKTHTDSWQYEIDSRNISSQNNHYNLSEMMVIAVSRILIEKVFENKYSTILPGIGIANLAAWLAYYRLKERDYPVNLIAEIGMFGYAPRPGDPFIFNHGNVQTSKMLTDSFQALGMMVAGETNSCIGALGTALVDKEGNLNTTLIAPQTLISGSGGGNDTVSGSREVIASVPHIPGRLVERVNYITSPGERVKTVVSTLGIFEKLGEDKELILSELLPSVEKPSIHERVREIKEKTGWEVKVRPDIQFMAPPQPEELFMLRLFDPHRHFIDK
ncbi:MAG: glutaconate CoA-transferase, partial [Deltaproteobacteria bacterium]|nr:glutaconate CoA-transferase [Deltaproteobacteria bacterium]